MIITVRPVASETLKALGDTVSMVSDPLSNLPDETARTCLTQIREWEGEVISSAELQERIPGFRAFRGIYRPAGAAHALWIRQTRRGVYHDEDPIFHPDGSWTYRYAPESQKGRDEKSLATNRGLL